MKNVLLLSLTVVFLKLSNANSYPCWPDSSITIVVLGSSTAAGIGASQSDSAWVSRYKAYLQSFNPGNEVINLAISATKTYQIMPTGFVPPSNRPNPNPNNNITKAIQLQADAIIVNMPSNDAFFGIGTSEQMYNFKTIAHQADSAGIPIWICTTQPRNLMPAQIQVQLEVRDSIFNYFGTNAIDFWTTIADSNNLPNPLYDSGDGIHLNDAGHRILFERVVQKNIPLQLMDTCSNVGIAIPLQAIITVYPNPNSGSFTISLMEKWDLKKTELNLFDLSGKEVYFFRPLNHKFTISLPSAIQPGVYLLQFKDDSKSVRKKLLVNN